MNQEYPIRIERRQSVNYKNCRPLNVHRYSGHPKVQKAVKALCELMHYKGFIAEKQTKIIVLDLYHCYKGDKTRFIKFYLSPNSYESIERYNWLGVSFAPVRKITERLFGLEMIEVKKGFKDVVSGHTESSKMRATEKLIAFLEKEHGVNLKMVTTIKDEEVIILKEKVWDVKRNMKIKKKKAYRDDKYTNAMRKVVTDYNVLTGKSYIDLDVMGYKYIRKVKKSDYDPSKEYPPLRIDLSRKRTYRVFMEDFDHGGRFYGPWWQGCPESLRQRITINGQHVVEYDFSGLHIVLLYALKGLKLGNKEPYVVPKDNDPHKLRKIYKLLMLTSVNCESDEQCVYVVEDELVGEMQEEPDKYPEKVPDLEAMLEELKKHHEPIKEYINKSTGLALQKIDSTIAEAVIKNMTEKQIPVLCVHDSFLCQERHADEVHKTMKIAFVEIIKEHLETLGIELKLEQEEVLTTECYDAIKLFPAYRRYSSIANLVTWSYVFKNKFTSRYIQYLFKRKTDFNEVITIEPKIELID